MRAAKPESLEVYPLWSQADASAFAPLDGHTTLLKAGALQDSSSNSANFSSIGSDERGVIQISNVWPNECLAANIQT